MAYENFIPEIWSARLLEHLDKTHVFANLVNRDYEGDIRAFGDTVHINQIGEVTIKRYDGSDIDDPEELSSEQTNLVIDQADYFNFQIKDVDNAQTNPKLMDDAMQRASYGMADTTDRFLAHMLADGVYSGNVVGSADSPVALTKTTAYEYLVDLATVLSEANVPMPGRWVVVPHWFYALLLKDERFVSFGTDANRAALQSAAVGSAAGFTIYTSNNAPGVYTVTSDTAVSSSKDYYVKNDYGLYTKVAAPVADDIASYYEKGTGEQVIAGTNIAGSYAEQLVELEPYRLEKNFSDAVKGLQVYGAKVVQPKALAVLFAKKG